VKNREKWRFGRESVAPGLTIPETGACKFLGKIERWALETVFHCQSRVKLDGRPLDLHIHWSTSRINIAIPILAALSERTSGQAA
jgi:hypothetical protein